MPQRKNTKSGFSEFSKPKGCTFKTKDFRRSFSLHGAVGHRSAALFQRGELSPQATEGCCGSEGSNFAAEQPQMNFCGFRRFNVNPSGAPRQLPLHKGAMSRCDFRLCATEKTNAEFKFSKLKVCTLFFCGGAVRCREPSSERKVSRESVTEGARGTKKWQKTAVLHLR